MEKITKAPGLRWRDGKPIWRASKPAIRAGYPVKTVNLASLPDEAAIIARATRLQVEMRAWLSGRTTGVPAYDGTFASLLKIYQLDPESTYRALKPSSLVPYNVYLRMLVLEIGARRIDACDGRDAKRWFKAWSEPATEGGRPRIAAARMAMAVLKSALSFGKICRLHGCAEFKSILDELEFPSLQPRTASPTAEQVIKARAAAHELGHPRAALCYALQFELTLRQWDVVGQWVPLSYKQPSAIFDHRAKWIGPSWSDIDANLIWSVTPTKTEDTTNAKVQFDLKSCPMVMEELALIPDDQRSGPLIVNFNTGIPYRPQAFRDAWRAAAKQAGIEPGVWNRDLRAGGNTEGQRADATLEDRKKIMGHSASSRMTAEVYDRDTVEVHRRVAAARVKWRTKSTET